MVLIFGITGKSTKRSLKNLKTQNDLKLRYERQKHSFHGDKHFCKSFAPVSKSCAFYMILH